MAVMNSTEKMLKNYRFEAFLQRMLSADFVKVQAYSPCVVQSSTEKLVFRHVVLTDEKIYLTEHPPRSVYAITSISDITDVKMISEQPSFLVGKHKETCQHVKITCRSRRPHKKSWKKRKSVSEQNLHITTDIMPKSATEHHPPITKSNSDSGSQVLDISSGRSSRLSRIFNLDFLTHTSSPTNTPLLYSPPVRSKLSNVFFPDSFTPTESWSRSSSQTSNGRISECSVSSLASTSDLMLNNFCDDEPKFKTEEINLYILNPNSKFASNLFLIWDTKLINSTLTSEDDTISNQLPFLKNEKIEKLFKELVEELLGNEENGEEFFHLLQELFSSLKKYKILRILFWKNSKLVQLLISNLEKLLLYPNPIEDKLENREDELEIALLILKIIHLPFLEQDNSSLRKLHLTANGNKHIHDIIQLSLSIPKLPHQYINTSKRMLNDYSQFSSNAWSNLPEAEIIQLSAAITNKQVLLLAEIIKHEVLEVEKICHFIELQSDQFVARCLAQLLTLLTKEEYYKPNEVISLYKYFYFLKFIISKSEKLKIKIINEYNEEFRYYVKSNLILVKIINCCPLKSTIEKLIQDVNKLMN